MTFAYKELLSQGHRKIMDDIESRIQSDNSNIQRICAKYLGSTKPYLPIKPKITVVNFYLDNKTKLGWCVNPKVSEKYSLKRIS